ncbi:PD-(D/E)XK nuclease family protein [Numidum massiliense]|uniref:PD-(D/E)XK nuclease family protein n=1 Tax=Numidum massiliense TaxID=1522315 RepID=UPI0006D54CE5|nr:PD-(D/E)XK nuclease family protein [Numidum massiliense]
MEILTHTRLQTRKNCPKADYWRNIRGLSPLKRKQSLSIGGAFHKGMETRSVQQAIDYLMRTSFASSPEEVTEVETAKVIVEAMVSGALEQWKILGDGRAEIKFEIPIINPRTGHSSRKFRLAGKSDELVQLEDGSWWVIEYKTAGQIGQAYVDRLDLDSQITTYIYGLQREFDITIDGVFYRVARKPSIRQTKKETLEQYRQRLIADYQNRPEFYFHEFQLYRSQEDLQAFEDELWGFTQEYLFAKRSGIHYKNTSRCTEFGGCPYMPLCRGVEGAENLFRYEVQNPELLEEGEHVSGRKTAANS